MHTATAARRAPDGVATLEERFEKLPIDAVIRSKTNPRTHFSDAYIHELAGSIAEKGLIQPIVVRPHPECSGFEIVAGECRWRASKLAGLDQVPSIIRSYTDEQVLEVQLIENIHRTDLTPLEQAVGYRRLIDQNPTKHSAESIAVRIGMSPAWVWDRLKLNDLIPDAKQLLEQERISVGHAIVIARLKPEDQKRVLKPDRSSINSYYNRSGLWVNETGLKFDDHERPSRKEDPYAGLKPKSIRELEAWIADHIRFDVAHAAKAAPLQFEPLAAEVQQAAAAPGRGKKVIPITLDHSAQTEAAKSEDERTYGATSWKPADSKTCEHAILGVVVAGRQYGRSFKVCIAREKCQVHWGREIRERAKRKTPARAASAKTESNPKAEAKRREKELRAAHERRLAEERRDLVEQRTIDAVLEQVKSADELVLRLVLSRMVQGDVSHEEFKRRFGIAVRYGGKLEPGPFKDLKGVELMKAVAFCVISDHLSWAGDVDDIGKLFKVDVKKIDAEVAAEQKAQGTPGTCRFCGCTETTPCIDDAGPCAWADQTETLCTNAKCMKAAAKTATARKKR